MVDYCERHILGEDFYFLDRHQLFLCLLRADEYIERLVTDKEGFKYLEKAAELLYSVERAGGRELEEIKRLRGILDDRNIEDFNTPPNYTDDPGYTSIYVLYYLRSRAQGGRNLEECAAEVREEVKKNIEAKRKEEEEKKNEEKKKPGAKKKKKSRSMKTQTMKTLRMKGHKMKKRAVKSVEDSNYEEEEGWYTEEESKDKDMGERDMGEWDKKHKDMGERDKKEEAMTGWTVNEEDKQEESDEEEGNEEEGDDNGYTKMLIEWCPWANTKRMKKRIKEINKLVQDNMPKLVEKINRAKQAKSDKEKKLEEAKNIEESCLVATSTLNKSPSTMVNEDKLSFASLDIGDVPASKEQELTPILNFWKQPVHVLTRYGSFF